ncbi:MAG: radical SAM protein [Chloroflexota bacterium]|nr:radical SAM protein [Chloroflexota bacterium]
MVSGYSLDTEKLTRTFELGPIRPPSEAYSLLIRATRNCPWNRCLFCHTYKGTKFELRSREDIFDDIEAAKAISEGIKEIAWRKGCGDRVNEVAAAVSNQLGYGSCMCHVALWLWAGAESAFLQDSDTLIMRTPELIQVIAFLRKTFPTLNRITSYARSHTSARKSLQELRELKDVGLDRIHTGLETGYDVLLAYMQKGTTAKQHIVGGKKVKEAGISLCEYVMPGLGGRDMSRQHALETARVLNEIDPDYIRLRSLHIRPDTPLRAKLLEGDFVLATEDEVVEEIGLFIDKLHVTSQLKSDHILNLLPEIEGKMPEDKHKCLDIINTYLSLSHEERLNFRLGRRAGYYEKLADLHDGYWHDKIEEAIKHLRSQGDDVDEVIFGLKDNFI